MFPDSRSFVSAVWGKVIGLLVHFSSHRYVEKTIGLQFYYRSTVVISALLQVGLLSSDGRVVVPGSARIKQIRRLVRRFAVKSDSISGNSMIVINYIRLPYGQLCSSFGIRFGPPNVKGETLFSRKRSIIARFSGTQRACCELKYVSCVYIRYTEYISSIVA